MAYQWDILDDELPELKTIILPRNDQRDRQPLRRSPRKNAGRNGEQLTAITSSVTATSSQRLSPAKKSPSKRSPLKLLPQASASRPLLAAVPVLPRNSIQTTAAIFSETAPLPKKAETNLKRDDVNERCLQTSRPKSTTMKRTTTMTTSAQTAKNESSYGRGASNTYSISRAQRINRFVLDEARCNEDLIDSDAQDEGEDEETDLSGFIVDDDAELSYHDSSDAINSDSEDEPRGRGEPRGQKPRRRLQRGRRKIDDSDNESDEHDELADALKNMKLNKDAGEHQQSKAVEVINLLSPEPRSPAHQLYDPFTTSKLDGTNLFDKFKALKLSPPRSSQSPGKLPSKLEPAMFVAPTDQGELKPKKEVETPPTTPPRSPSKLKSPSKLFSPSKRGDGTQQSPHRPSMDAFWDLNEINEWNDQYSPKKAPVASPRKNRLLDFDIWSEGDNEEDDDSLETLNDASESLPSPCASPSKSRSKLTSPMKAEHNRLLAEKRARQLEKTVFERTRDQMAKDLLSTLDVNVTGSRISKLSASTGGVQILWSKTLRSTAGRANWRRTVTKPTGSPVKGKSEESAPETVIKHFANIELAVKVIDRRDRLINTLAHEFCHLANFMISGIRDQPHGASFKKWAQKVTTFMRNQDEVPEWKGVEVTTKHGYVIEWKYLWICVGRKDQNAAMKFLNINEDDDEEEGCGAEYGRHSKSIDTTTQRCGRCKGRLVQVRPKPRVSPVKSTTSERGLRSERRKASGESGKDVTVLEQMVEVVELSD